MSKIESDAEQSTSFKNSVSKIKTNRYMQIAAIVVFLLLVSLPAYSLYLGITTPANAHERENYYIVLEDDWGSISWVERTEVSLSDGESFSILMDDSQFPSEADGMNIVMVMFSSTLWILMVTMKKHLVWGAHGMMERTLTIMFLH